MSVEVAVGDLATSRDEAWKYTPVEEIIARTTAATDATRATAPPLCRSIVDSLAGDHRGPRLVFVNGFHAAALSDRVDLPVGLWCGVSGTRDDIAVVLADDGLQFDEPVHIVHLAVADDRGADRGTISRPRTIVDIGAGSRLTVVETYCGLDTPSVTHASTTIRLGDRAVLDQCRLQRESAGATHVGHTTIEHGASSRLRMTTVTLGADIARNAIDVRLLAPDARAELTGIDVVARRQRHDTVVTVDHCASRCVSSQRFIGVADDHGRTSFSGEIIVRPGTVATDAHQSNRNLVLSANAEADARPWLRILADDVRCTHGATVGRLDDDALFYLRSRGIALAAARTMLIEGFMRDVTDAIAHEAVRAEVAAAVAAATSAGTPNTKRMEERA